MPKWLGKKSGKDDFINIITKFIGEINKNFEIQPLDLFKQLLCNGKILTLKSI
jgi:hypothetical protein